MEPLFELGLNATRSLQESFPQLRSFFIFITNFGSEEFFLLFMPLFYWCVHKRMGRHFAYLFLITLALNSLGKATFRGPRPFWLDPSVAQSDASSFGVPSGHSQLTAVNVFLLAAYAKRIWLWPLAILFVLLMMLSRVYLGVHFVHDVIIGFLLGLLLLVGYWAWERRIGKPFRNRILGFRLMIALLVPFGFTAVYILVRLLIGEPPTDVSYASRIPPADIEALEDMVTSIAALFAAGIGLLLEQSRVRFRTEGKLWQRVARYAVGMIVSVLIWGGLRALFPEEPLWLAIPLRFIRYTLLLLWITYFAPLVFVRLKLAEADPDPEISVTPG